MALFEDYLDAMDEILDKAQAIPFSSKKSVVDVEDATKNTTVEWFS